MLTLSYEVHGSGDHTLVYLHGLLMDAAVNRRLARDLADAGNRVILLDLPGHGASEKPLSASAHRMDAYARNVVALLDELALDRAVVGGMSLGADVSLQVAVLAPERLAGLVIEMPVLEQATPYAALLFTPLLAAANYLKPVLRVTSGLLRRVPRHRLGPLDAIFGPVTLEPEELMAVLHGVLVGPVAPTAAQRQAMEVPTLVVGHGADWLHPLRRRRKAGPPTARRPAHRGPLDLRAADAPGPAHRRDRCLPRRGVGRRESAPGPLRLVVGHAPPPPLDLAPPALVGQAAFLRPPGRPGRPARGVHRQPPGDAGRQPFEGDLAVPGLRALVGRRGTHHRSQALEQAGPLAGPEGAGGLDVEPHLHPAERAVGVLAPRAPRSGGPPLTSARGIESDRLTRSHPSSSAPITRA